MLQYLVILLDDTSVSFCHYDNANTERRLMTLNTLRAGIRFAMFENLTIQFVYPDYALPPEYASVIESIDHTKIKPLSALDSETDVVVVDGFGYDLAALSDAVVALRAPWSEISENREKISATLRAVKRLNVVITDLERMTDADRDGYKSLLAALADDVETLYVEGKSPQLNLLTDRMMLDAMNNCGAGDTSITLAPDGRFYVCPAFYSGADDDDFVCGSLDGGLDIKNRPLYRLDHAPICRVCDAWHCRRCVWLNRKTTLEVNTPSREQCVTAHIEREEARKLMARLRQKGTFLPDKEEIKELPYLDPFEIASRWK